MQLHVHHQVNGIGGTNRNTWLSLGVLTSQADAIRELVRQAMVKAARHKRIEVRELAFMRHLVNLSHRAGIAWYPTVPDPTMLKVLSATETTSIEVLYVEGFTPAQRYFECDLMHVEVSDLPPADRFSTYTAVELRDLFKDFDWDDVKYRRSIEGTIHRWTTNADDIDGRLKAEFPRIETPEEVDAMRAEAQRMADEEGYE